LIFPPEPIPFDEQDDVYKQFYKKIAEISRVLFESDRALEQTNDTNGSSDTNSASGSKKSPLELLKGTVPILEEKEHFVIASLIDDIENELLTPESFSGYVTSMRTWHKNTLDLFSFLLVVVDPPEPVKYADLDADSKAYFETHHNAPNKMESLGPDLDEFLNFVERPTHTFALKSIIMNKDLTELSFCQNVVLFPESAQKYFQFVNAFIDTTIELDSNSGPLPANCSSLFDNMLEKPSSKFTFDTVRNNEEENGKLSAAGVKVFKRIICSPYRRQF